MQNLCSGAAVQCTLTCPFDFCLHQVSHFVLDVLTFIASRATTRAGHDGQRLGRHLVLAPER